MSSSRRSKRKNVAFSPSFLVSFSFFFFFRFLLAARVSTLACLSRDFFRRNGLTNVCMYLVTRYLAVVTSYTRNSPTFVATVWRAIRVYRSRNALRPRTTAAGSILVPLFPTSRRVPTSFHRAVCPPCPPIPPAVPFSLPTIRIARSRGRLPPDSTDTTRRPPEQEDAHDDEVCDDDALNLCATEPKPTTYESSSSSSSTTPCLRLFSSLTLSAFSGLTFLMPASIRAFILRPSPPQPAKCHFSRHRLNVLLAKKKEEILASSMWHGFKCIFRLVYSEWGKFPFRKLGSLELW